MMDMLKQRLWAATSLMVMVYMIWQGMSQNGLLMYTRVIIMLIPHQITRPARNLVRTV